MSDPAAGDCTNGECGCSANDMFEYEAAGFIPPISKGDEAVVDGVFMLDGMRGATTAHSFILPLAGLGMNAIEDGAD